MGQQQSTSTDQRSFRRTVVVAFAWLFTALAMLSLLSPPGVSNDELFHAPSIWCANGERTNLCEDISPDAEVGKRARTNVDIALCQKDVTQPAACPSAATGQSTTRINDGLYPSLFYRVMGLVVVPSMEMSFILVRWANALSVVVLFAASLVILPSRHRTALLLVILSILNPHGFYLFASLNPSSWAVAGVGVAWMALHAALTREAKTTRHRLALVGISIVAGGMAAGSRRDAISFLALSGILLYIALVTSYFPKRRGVVLGSSGLLVVLVFFGMERFNSLSPAAELRKLVIYDEGEPDNLAFFTHHVLQSVPRALEALGQVPAQTGVLIPQIVFLAGLFVLGFVGALALNTRSRLQLLGIAVTLVFSVLVAMAWQALVDNRDSFGPRTRYVLPLTVFAVGWFYVFGPVDLAQRVQKHLRWMAVVVTFAFGLTVLAIAERNVDFQTLGLRLIPEGPDQWWWSWMPVGPNIVVLAAVLSMWQFLRRFPALIAGPRT